MSASENDGGNPTAFWQESKSLGECLLYIYDLGLLADVSFQCTDHVKDDPNDCLRAHKMVLATRSAVFFAMFYGPNRDDGTEIQILSEFSKQAMNIFLRFLSQMEQKLELYRENHRQMNELLTRNHRFLYSDTASLEISIAEDVFKIAHYYQVSQLVKLCCDFISQTLSIGNACTFLELACVYTQRKLRDDVLDFIDSNAKAVLESDSFLSLSKDTLKYLLKGDTLHLEEITILKGVHAWATPRLTAEGQDVNGENIRRLLGEDVFYHIRMPAMSIQDFIKVERMFNYHSNTETTNIASFILKHRNPKRVSMHSSKPRVERFEQSKIKSETIIASVLTESTIESIRPKTNVKSAYESLIGNPKIRMTFYDNRSLLNSDILSISLNIPEFCVPCREQTHKLDGSFRVLYEINCLELRYQYSDAKMMKPEAVTLALDPPLTLSRNDVTLTVELSAQSPISFLNACQVNRREVVTIKICRNSQRELADEVSDDDECTLPEDWEDVFKPSSGQ